MKRNLILVFLVAFVLSSCSQEPSIETSADSVEYKTYESCSFRVPQQGSNEPRYVGLEGFLVNPQHEYRDDSRELPNLEKPVPTLIQTGPEKWDSKGPTYPSRTKIKIISQSLEHRRHGIYEGILKARVNINNESQVILIRPENFMPVQYWQCPVQQAIDYYPIIAIPRNENVKPVDSRTGEWEEWGQNKKVFCKGRASPPYDHGLKNPILCLLYKQYEGGYGGSEAVFSADDLEMVK